MPMETTRRLQHIAFTGRLLGALFYYSPDDERTAPVIAAFHSPGWSEEWPFATPDIDALANRLADAFREEKTPLQETWQRLFIGPDRLPAPPWGSVWLDPDNVLFGDSLLALREWMRARGIAYQATQNEPEDHIGTLLMLAAWCAESGQQQALDELLAWHMMPWIPRFLAVFNQQANSPVYQAIGELTALTLHAWQAASLIPVAEKKLWL